ncbi:MAG: hypothetical protein PHQ65_09575 [Bacteroidales bacterium]|jgi:hypothetical protein|nr:hypothetical protein [Bacteroidales bacterium]MDD3665499.1 hypothetical protein [Bacteroidales bacterium]
MKKIATFFLVFFTLQANAQVELYNDTIHHTSYSVSFAGSSDYGDSDVFAFSFGYRFSRATNLVVSGGGLTGYRGKAFIAPSLVLQSPEAAYLQTALAVGIIKTFDDALPSVPVSFTVFRRFNLNERWHLFPELGAGTTLILESGYNPSSTPQLLFSTGFNLGYSLSNGSNLLIATGVSYGNKVFILSSGLALII